MEIRTIICLFAFTFFSLNSFAITKYMNVQAKNSGGVIQGTFRLNKEHLLIIQDPDGSKAHQKLSFSIVNNSGALQASWSHPSSNPLEDPLGCNNKTNPTDPTMNACGTHGQSSFRVGNYFYLASPSNDGFIEFVMDIPQATQNAPYPIPTSIKFNRNIKVLGPKGPLNFSVFSVNAREKRIAVNYRHASSKKHRVSIFSFDAKSLPHGPDKIKLSVPNNTKLLNDFELVGIPGTMQGITYIGDSIYVLAGHISSEQRKVILRYSEKTGALLYTYHIVEGLEEARKSDFMITSKKGDDYFSGNCPSDYKKEPIADQCSFHYYEPEAIFSGYNKNNQAQIFFTMVHAHYARNGKGEIIVKDGVQQILKPKMMYYLNEYELKKKP